MWILVIALTVCLDTDPSCKPGDYVYVARFATESECRRRIKKGDEALYCVRE